MNQEMSLDELVKRTNVLSAAVVDLNNYVVEMKKQQEKTVKEEELKKVETTYHEKVESIEETDSYVSCFDSD